MKLLSSDKAVSEVIGHVIILGLTLSGISLIVLVGVPSIYKMQDMVTMRNLEQTFTVLDSRASNALMGEAPMQVVDVNLGGGILAVEPNGTGKESYMTVKSANNTFSFKLPMGKVKYVLGERIVAYEGGGIWSKYPSGGSVMLSPPEFHFNGRTLTLPVININGSGSIGGKGTGRLSFKKNPLQILYPNTSKDKNYTNPLDFIINGKVYVNITSDYYDAWADYAKSLIYTKVSTNATKHTVSIELTVAPSTLGGATEITNPINLRGLPSDDPTPLDNFSFIIYTDGMNKWDLRAKNGNRSFIIYLDQFNRLSIGYRDTDISTTGETWGPSPPYPTLHDEEGEDYIYVDLLSNSTYLSYSNVNNIGADNSAECKVYTSQFDGTIEPDYSWDDLYITKTNANKTQSLFNITQHYTWKMAQIRDISFGECVPSGKKLPGDGSTVTMGYNTTGGITFLHVTNNTADVGIR